MIETFNSKIEGKLQEGSYIIMDLIYNNVFKSDEGLPLLIAANVSEQDLKDISTGKIKIPNPLVGTKYRVLLKVEKINSVENIIQPTVIKYEK